MVVSLSIAAGASAGGGGVDPGDPPKVTDIQCIAKCAGLRKAAAGSRIELTGRHLSRIREVSFNQEGGGRVEVDPIASESRSVRARVPDGAATGKPRAIDRADNAYTSPEELVIVDPDDIPDDEGFELRQIEATPHTAFLFGERDARVKYSFAGAETDVRILVVRRKSEKVVRSILTRNREPFVEHTARWNGKDDAGNDATAGKYRFKIGPRSGGHPDTGEKATFSYRDHKFPVTARHSYGDGIGAGRGHQGQDVFARCGTPLVAARGGKVQWKRFHSSAGYYVVIDGKGTRRDYVYMHMLKGGRPDEGKAVHTGERIGTLSDTGNATGCHLHFEIWSPPGWYEGGHFTNPTDDLKRWDRYS